MYLLGKSINTWNTYTLIAVPRPMTPLEGLRGR